MNKKLFLLAICLLFTICGNAQNWQWGKSGGSSSSSISGPGTDEIVVDMTTDTHGNLYVLSNVLQVGLNIDGHPKTGYGFEDIMLSSFKCDGTYRWSKMIGGNSNDVGIALKTDTLGGVYVLTSVAWGITTGGHIDADAAVTTTSKACLLIKYDTAGVYQWHRFPQSDTVTTSSVLNTYPIDMDVDKSGNSYGLYQLASGAYGGGGFVAPSTGMYILKYDKTGAFISGNHIDISFTSSGARLLKLKRDHGNGKYVVTGTIPYSSGTLSFGSTPITHPMMVGYFNALGNLIWVKQDADDILFGSSFGRAVVNTQHTIYLGGRASNTDVFNGYSILNGGNTATPFVVAMDTMGANIWTKNATVNGATGCKNITLNGNEVVIAGQYPGKIKWPGFPDSLNLAVGTVYDVFFTRLNASTGAVIGMDSLASSFGFMEDATAITSDNSGSFYIGGNFANTITIAGTTHTTAGGGSDFFIAKYGYSTCGCTLPASGFTSVGTHTVNFTYTGTTSYDSVRWTFSDGGTSTLAAPVHVFTATGVYTACVTVYTPCGSDMHCQTVNVTVAIGGVAVNGFESVNIYPNPVSGQLIIGNISEGTMVSLYNIIGREMYHGKATGSSHQVSMQAMPPGSYIIELIDSDGNRLKRSIIKQ